MRGDHATVDELERKQMKAASPTAEKLARCLLCFVVLFLFCLVDAGMAWKQENDFSAKEKAGGMALYRFEDWAGKTATNYSHIVTNWVADFGAADVVNVRRWGADSVESNETGVVTRRWYVFNPKATTNQEWTCNSEEYPSVADAHKMMLLRFLGGTSPTYRPRRGAQEGIKVGDVSFVRSKPSDRGRVIYFCRNNVFVEVGIDGTNYAPCVAIANHLDAQILKKSSAE